MTGTVPDEFDRPLNEIEKAVINVRNAASAAIQAGASVEQIMKEASYGIGLARKLYP